MTEPRFTVDTINSDQLDALYDRLEAAEETESQRQLATAREALASATVRAAKAERAANLLADSHRRAEALEAALGETAVDAMKHRFCAMRENGILRRAEQAEAELQRLRTESPWLRATAEDLAAAQAAIARVRALADAAKPAISRSLCCCTTDICECDRGAEPIAWTLNPADVLAALDEPKEPTT